MSLVATLARPEILGLEPYGHAEWDPAFERLHANENPWRNPGDYTLSGLNRYPAPYAVELEAQLAALYGVEPAQLIAARGSDECIDLLMRAFCIPGKDAVLICPPTFGMYRFAARIQGALVLEAPLRRNDGFALDEPVIGQTLTPAVKLLFLCTPNNPTGNAFDRAAVERLATRLTGRTLLVVDEAYAEFSSSASFIARLSEFPNLVVLRTLSKAYALAGARCGALIAAPEIVAMLRQIIPPYAISSPTNEAVLSALDPLVRAAARGRMRDIRRERAKLMAKLSVVAGVIKIWPSQANFLLVELEDARRALAAARDAGLLLRDLSQSTWTPGCLRISVGTPEQNDRLVAAIARAASP